jgi:membrane fusion protein (multidrug efflux system)
LPDNPAETAPAKPPSKPLFKRPVTWIALVVVLAAVGTYGAYWWTTARFIQSTDDAYLQADQVTIAPRVSGYVSAVLVGDNQPVQAGQPLVRIDPANYQATLTQQVAARDARQADVAVSSAQYQQQLADVQQAQARLAGDQVDARFAASQVARYRGLAASGAETAETLAKMINQRDRADATVRTDTAALLASQQQSKTTEAQVKQAQAQVETAAAAVQTAQLDVDHTLLRASIAGTVADRTVRIGQYVQPGTRLLTLVPVQAIYVSANFKETQLDRIKIGQHAQVTVDALNGRSIDGTVQSIAPGTGAEFALLPPENATGNFTKIVQRVAVRLVLHADAAKLSRLVPGLSVTVTINTAQQDGSP